MDPANLADLFDAQGPALVLYARQWLDRAGAEDVVQEVFVRLMAQERAPPNAKAWLYLAARRAAIDAARADRRRGERERAVAARSAAGAPLLQPGPDDRLDAAAAEAALHDLPPALREVVVLRIWGAMTLAEVAAVTGAAVSTVYDQYRAALARVRQKLEPSCEANGTIRPAAVRPPGAGVELGRTGP